MDRFNESRRTENEFNANERARREADDELSIRLGRPVTTMECVVDLVELACGEFVTQNALKLRASPLQRHYPRDGEIHSDGLRTPVTFALNVPKGDTQRQASFVVGRRVMVALFDLPPRRPWPELRDRDEAARPPEGLAERMVLVRPTDWSGYSRQRRLRIASSEIARAAAVLAAGAPFGSQYATRALGARMVGWLGLAAETVGCPISEEWLARELDKLRADALNDWRAILLDVLSELLHDLAWYAQTPTPPTSDAIGRACESLMALSMRALEMP